MNELNINLNIISDIQTFLQAINLVSDKVIMKSGKYIVDAKSIMGVYSLDLSKPITLEIDADEFPKTFLNKIKHMIID